MLLSVLVDVRDQLARSRIIGEISRLEASARGETWGSAIALAKCCGVHADKHLAGFLEIAHMRELAERAAASHERQEP